MALPQLSLGWLKQVPRGRWLDWTLPLGFGLALVVLTPWRTTYGFGMDEGFELMKALLVSRGHALYGDFWNDQPPLHTELLALLFRMFGPSAGAGRLLSIGFAVVLVAALYGLVRRAVNRPAGVLAVVLLASASQVLTLSVSAMLELPAFALGLAAVWAWYRRAEGGGRGWLAVSGMLMGCALQVKFTAGLLLPALAAAWWMELRSERSDRSGPARSRWREGWLWLASLGAALGVVVLLCYGPGAWAMFARSHFSSGTRAAAAAGPALRPGQLLDDAGLVLLALLGLALQVWKRDRKLWFPVVWLLTVLVVHWQHRPYWSYYHLHFALPLAWLGGAGVVEGFRRIWRMFPSSGRAGWWWPGLAWTGWSLAFAGGLSLALEKAAGELGRLQRAGPASADQNVQVLKAHGAGIRWVFTHDLLAAFWAGLPIPPELAVIPWKRLWSGQLTPAQIHAHLERYRPELILLPEWRRREYGLEDHLKAHYQPAASTPDLFLRR
jgi:4-amino-4-deoxy-L-arabinose transferase-like glycosyltransferase